MSLTAAPVRALQALTQRANFAEESPRDGGFSRGDMLVLAAITVLAVALRVYRLGDWAFWVDEAHTYRDMIAPWPEFQDSKVSSYPLSYLLLRALVSLGMATSEGWLRLPFAFFGALSIPALALAGRAIVGRREALVAALILAVSPWHIYWSQNARSYAMVLFFALLSAACFFSGYQRRRARLLIASLVFALIAGLCHPSAHLLFVAFFAHGLLSRRRDAGRKRSRLALWLPVLLLAVVGGLFLWLLPVIEHVREVKASFSFLHLLQTTGFFVRIPLIFAALGGVLLLVERDDPAGTFLTCWVVAPLLALGLVALGFLQVTGPVCVLHPACLRSARWSHGGRLGEPSARQQPSQRSVAGGAACDPGVRHVRARLPLLRALPR